MIQSSAPGTIRDDFKSRLQSNVCLSINDNSGLSASSYYSATNEAASGMTAKLPYSIFSGPNIPTVGIINGRFEQT